MSQPKLKIYLKERWSFGIITKYTAIRKQKLFRAQVADIFSCGTNILRRGVRSDAQLRSTETRFQKCSQSGKNGSKHPMLSISYNAKNKK